MTHRPLILLEFKALSPDLLERLMGMGCLPNFQRLHDASEIFVTDRGGDGVERGEGDTAAPRMWDVVSAAGFPVCVWGSTNAVYGPGIRGVVLPDPWTTKAAPHPEALRPFFRFVQQQNMLEPASGRMPLRACDYAAFGTFMMAHGMSAGTVTAVVRQLLDEGFREGDSRATRAALLDRLQFDVFRWYYRRTRPLFSTFVSNGVADGECASGADLDPDLIAARPTPEREAAHQHTVLAGYREMDALIGRFLKLAGPDTTVVFATGTCEPPRAADDKRDGEMKYRPADVARLVRFAGVTEGHSIAPLKAELFTLRFESEVDAVRVQAKLRTLKVAGRPAMAVRRDGPLLTGRCQLREQVPAGAQLVRGESGPAAGFFDMFSPLEESTSAMLHPDGMLWVRAPGQPPRTHAGTIPLASVAPTLLGLMGLPVPPRTAAAVFGPHAAAAV